MLYDRRHVTGVALLTHPSSKARSVSQTVIMTAIAHSGSSWFLCIG